MELLQDVKDMGSTAEELRATASVLTTLSRYLEGKDRAAVLGRATAALVRAHEASKSPKDLYNLSQLHKVAGNLAESRACLQKLLNQDGTNIYYLVAGPVRKVTVRPCEVVVITDGLSAVIVTQGFPVMTARDRSSRPT